MYQDKSIGLAPGIHEPLCGWDFYNQHKHDVIPCEFETFGDVHYKVSIKDTTQTNKIIKSIYERR